MINNHNVKYPLLYEVWNELKITNPNQTNNDDLNIAKIIKLYKSKNIDFNKIIM